MIRMKSTLTAFAGAMLCMLFAACSQGPGSSGTTGMGGSAPTGKYGDGLCGKCVDSACACLVATCNGDPPCAQYLTCLDGCPVTAPEGDADPACASQCAKSSGSAAVQEIGALDACRTTGPGASCVACGGSSISSGPGPDACPGPDAGAGAWDWILTQSCPPSQETDPCHLCEDEHCCETHDAYDNDPAAEAYFQCWRACAGTPGCADGCAQTAPGGVKNFAPRLACLDEFCSTACIATPNNAMPNSCLECTYSSCASAFVNANANADGFLLQDCLSLCDPEDTSCVSACFAEYLDAAGLVEALGACIREECSMQCG